MASPSAASDASAVRPKRKSLGGIAFLIAVMAFVLFMGSYGFFFTMQRTDWFAAQNASFLAFMVVVIFVVPPIELVGVILGFISLFRSGDRKVLGLIGALLNALLLVGGLPVAIALFANSGR